MDLQITAAIFQLIFRKLYLTKMFQRKRMLLMQLLHTSLLLMQINIFWISVMKSL